METATVTEAKNGLSALLDRVRAGESILITDRGIPVAIMEPYTVVPDLLPRMRELSRAGRSRLGTGELPPHLLSRPRHSLQDGASLLEAVLEERSAGW